MRYFISELIAMVCLFISFYLMYKGENTGGFYGLLVGIFNILIGIGDLLYERFKDNY